MYSKKISVFLIQSRNDLITLTIIKRQVYFHFVTMWINSSFISSYHIFLLEHKTLLLDYTHSTNPNLGILAAFLAYSNVFVDLLGAASVILELFLDEFLADNGSFLAVQYHVDPS